MKISIFATAAICCLALPAYGDTTGGIDGSVVDAATHQVAAHVAIQIACGTVQRSATTDAAGHFAIAGLPDGDCTITASGGGFTTVSLRVTLAGGSITTVLVHVMTAAELQQQQHEMALRSNRMQVAPAAAAPRHAAPPVAPTPAPPPPPRVALRAGPSWQAERPVHLQQLPHEHPVQIAQDLNGWAMVRAFPVPQYTRGFDGPRTDFRETIYWNPTVQTDARGDAELSFVASDAITAFRATAEGFSAAGLPGGGQATFQSKLPLTIDAVLPLEVTAGDTLRLPVTLSNETDDAIDATLDAAFGAAFRLGHRPDGAVHLAPHAKRSVFFPLDVVATDGNADVSLKLTGRGLTDELARKVRIVPRGFPITDAASGTARRGTAVRHTIDLGAALAGTAHATVTLYPSPVAAMTDGMAGMIREPVGCFEQASATNYPNIMILGYLSSTQAADPALIARTQTTLASGYKKLVGYETPMRGYEWFGKSPGHEALTAYGLMEFADMAKVYDVDAGMVERTAEWLMRRRDHRGGFLRSDLALDTFGHAGADVTNAYIIWALAEARRTTGLSEELAAQTRLGQATRDPYLLALAANTILLTAPRDAQAMVQALVGLQAKDGSFPNAKESITKSGGESLTIEATALAALALVKASPHQEHESELRRAIDWINSQRGAFGSWSNTQATILGLKALTAYSEHARKMTAGGSAILVVNGKDAGTIQFAAGQRDALVWHDLDGKLTAGANTIELRLDSDAALPYTIAVDYRSNRPASSPRAKLAVDARLLETAAKLGDAVTLRVHVENTSPDGLPMALARIGLPGGTTFQTWQLQELRDKGLVDFYETRPREVILYWRSLAPSVKKDLDLHLLATTPGNYEAPASSAYLYYTAEDKAWTPPVSITIEP